LQIGDPAVGKTALTQMFHSNGQRFPKAYNMTCGVDFCVKAVTVPGTTDAVEFHCFDVGGQDIFSEMFGSYCEGTKAVLLVYDVTRRETFNHLNTWLEDARQHSNINMTIMLICNKCYLEQKRQVTTEEGEAFAKEHGLVFLETSAKTAHNVDDAFVQTAQAIYEKIAQGVFDVSNESFGIRLGTQQSASGPSGRAGAAKASGGCC
jgi:Ras-related protein Rab-2A